MDEVGDDFLAGAAFAGDEDGKVAGGDFFDGADNGLHGQALENGGGAAAHGGEGLAEGAGFLVEALVFQGALDGEEEGFVKIHVRKGTDKILGATIVARHAGEMLSEITLAIAGNVGLGTLANVIHTYPTQAEAIKQVADAYNRTRLTPFFKGMLTGWLAWRR